MLWSSASIAGRPRLLIIDASGNKLGWEAQLAEQFAATMVRRKVDLVGGAPVRVAVPEDLAGHAGPLAAANCLVLLADGLDGAHSLKAHWDWLTDHVVGPKLVAACSWESYDAAVNGAILSKEQDFAPFAVAPKGPVTQREGGLFLLKFFTEVALHSEDQITGKMVWFSWSKARELLKRRRLRDAFAVRA